MAVFYKAITSAFGRKIISNRKDAIKIIKAVSNPEIYGEGVNVKLENGKIIIVKTSYNKNK